MQSAAMKINNLWEKFAEDKADIGTIAASLTGAIPDASASPEPLALHRAV